MSGFWAFAMPVVCLAIIGEFVIRIVKVAKSRGSSAGIQDSVKALEDDITGLEEDLEDTRARIEVLEKIVTDDKYDLDKEIKNLG